MDKVRIIILIACLSLVYTSALNAQTCSITGYVTLQGETVNDGTIVNLLDSLNASIISWTASDEQGAFNIDGIKYGRYNLNLFQFGYKDTLISFNCNQAKIKLKSTELKALSLTIAPISIIDKMIYYSKTKDTTTFNIKAYERGQELSVTDIIGAISGFSVTNNRIYYDNKAVDDVLLNGISLSDSDQSDFTDKIQYRTLKDIRIIENYLTKNYEDGDSLNKRIALDIRLKDEYKTIGQNTARLGITNNLLYNINVSRIKPFINSGYNISIDARSIPEQNEQSIDDLIQSNNQDMLFRNRNNVFSYNHPITYTQLSDANPNKSNTQKLKLIYNYQPPNGLNYKSTTNIGTGIQNSSSVIQRNFINNPSVNSFQVIGDNAFKNYRIQTNQQITYSMSDYLDAQFYIPILYQGNSSNKSEKYLFNTLATNNTSDYNRSVVNISPFYKLNFTLGNNYKLQIFGLNEFSTLKKNLAIINSEEIMDVSIQNHVDGLYLADQATDWATLRTNNQINVTKNIKWFTIKYNIQSITLDQQINQTSEQRIDQLIGSRDFEGRSISNNLELAARKSFFSVITGLNHTWSRSKSLVTNYNASNLNPYLLLVIKLKSKYSFSIGYTPVILSPDLSITSGLTTLTSIITKENTAIKASDFVKRNNFSLSFFKNYEVDAEDRFIFNSSLNYAPNYTQFQLINYNKSSFIENIYQLVNYKNDFSIFATILKDISKFRINTSLRAISNQALLPSKVIKTQNITAQVGLIYAISKKLKLSIQNNYAVSKRSSTEAEFRNNNFSNLVGCFHYFGSFNQKLIFQSIFNQNTTSYNSYYQLNYEINYKSKKYNAEVGVTIHDLLNLTSITVMTSQFNLDRIDNISYVTFPGYIMLDAKKYF